MPRYTNIGKCSWVFTRGPKKFTLCNKNATRTVGDKYFCWKHFNKGEAEYFRIRQLEEDEEGSESLNSEDEVNFDTNIFFNSNDKKEEESESLEEEEEEEDSLGTKEKEATETLNMLGDLNIPTVALDFDIEDCFLTKEQEEELEREKKKRKRELNKNTKKDNFIKEDEKEHEDDDDEEEEEEFDKDIMKKIEKYEIEIKESREMLNELALVGYNSILRAMLNYMGKNPDLADAISCSNEVKKCLQLVIKENGNKIPRPEERPGMYLILLTAINLAAISSEDIRPPSFNGEKKRNTGDRKKEEQEVFLSGSKSMGFI